MFIPARMYMTPVMRTAEIWRFIIPKVPSRAADARRITQTIAQEIDKLCISNGEKDTQREEITNELLFHLNV